MKMGNRLRPCIKVFSMINEKKTFQKFVIILAIVLSLLVFVFSVISLKIMHPEFKIYGDEALLKDIKINIKFIRKQYDRDDEAKLVTALYEGKRYKVQERYADSYIFYLSYKDSLVTMFETENLMQHANDYINHLYVKKDEQGQIYLFYVGTETHIKNGWGLKTPSVIPLHQFFKKENITDKEEQEKYKSYFFDFHNPDRSFYKIVSEIPKHKNKDEILYKTYLGKYYTLEKLENFELNNRNIML